MSGLLRRTGLTLTVSALIGALGSTSANAYDYTKMVKSFDVAVTGHISVVCSISQTGTSAVFGNPVDPKTGGASTSSTVALAFALKCNTPFAMRLYSSNGGLTAATADTTKTFANAIDYAASVVWASGAKAITNCAASKMQTKPPAAGTNGTGSANDACTALSTTPMNSDSSANLNLTLLAGSMPLANTTYSDRITVWVAPSV